MKKRILCFAILIASVSGPSFAVNMGDTPESVCYTEQGVSKTLWQQVQMWWAGCP